MLKQLEREQFNRIYEIMKNSFPKDERRPCEEQKDLLERPEYKIYIMDRDDEICGFLAVWEFNSITFIEHFAVAPEYRNMGIGAEMLQELKSTMDKRICLEVEPPENELTRRRIGFYERNGFFLNKQPYVQPPLSKGQEEVSLLLMTTGGKVDDLGFDEIKTLLYEKVYEVDKMQSTCNVCPRECNVDRKNGKLSVPERLFICGRNLAFPEKKDPERYSFPAVLSAVSIVRIMILHM